MNTFEIAIAIFGLVLLAWAVTGTKETAGSRLLAIVISLIALTVAALAAIVFQVRVGDEHHRLRPCQHPRPRP